MLSNACFLANFCFDTAENEPAKILRSFLNVANLVIVLPRSETVGEPFGLDEAVAEAQADPAEGRRVHALQSMLARANRSSEEMQRVQVALRSELKQ